MQRTYIILSIFFTGVVLIFSCQHEIVYPNSGGTTDTTQVPIPPPAPPPSLPPPITGSSCSPDTVYFTNTILPLLSSNCAMSGCHNGLSGGDAGEYTLNTFAGIKKIVIAGNAGSSKLIDVITNGNMPPRGHTPISVSQLADITTWINQGALNNTCTAGSCDTTNVSYSATISTILQNNCTGCHSGSAPSGAGIDLTTYANVLVQANNGKLWGDISHSTGYNAMPLGGASLSACDLNMISSWIKKGAPNN
jgi:hypothetical protein